MTVSNSEIIWWAYIHENGSLQLKRFFDNRDLEEAEESPFVKDVLGTTIASSREEAMEYFIKAYRLDK